MTKNEMMQKIFQMEDSDLKEVAVKGVLNNDEHIMDVLKMDGLSTKEMEETIGLLTKENSVDKEVAQTKVQPLVVDDNMSEEEYNKTVDEWINTKKSVEQYEKYQGEGREDFKKEQQEKAEATRARVAERERLRNEEEARKAAEQERENERARKFNELSQTTELGHKNIRKLSDEELDNAYRKYVLKENDGISVETEVSDNENSTKKGFDSLTEQEIVTLQATVDPETLSESQKKSIREELGLAKDAEITNENLLDAKDELFNLHYQYDINNQEQGQENENETSIDNQTPVEAEPSNNNTSPEDQEAEAAGKSMMIKDKGRQIVTKITNKVMNLDSEKAIKVLIIVAAGAAVIASGGTALGLAPMASLTTVGVGAAGGYAANEFNKGRKGK